MCIRDSVKLSPGEIRGQLNNIPDSFHIIDLETLRQLESKIDCSDFLCRTIVLARPNELMLNGFNRTDVRGLVSWGSDTNSLNDALSALKLGRAFIDPLLVKTIDEIALNGTSLLTNRQMQILRMVADGKSSREIADELQLSRRTVENHRARILERLRVNSAAQMIEVAHRNNWV